MQLNEHIHLKSEGLEVNLNWEGFDGDDCFNDFHIVVIAGAETTQYEFGPCAVRSLRKWTKFFSDSSEATVGAGFRNPDIRYCDLSRSGANYRLVITFEGTDMRQVFEILNPVLHLNHGFLEAYDGMS